MDKLETSITAVKNPTHSYKKPDTANMTILFTLIHSFSVCFFPPTESSMNLFEFIDMRTDNGHGTIMNMKNLLERFHCQVDWLESS